MDLIFLGASGGGGCSWYSFAGGSLIGQGVFQGTPTPSTQTLPGSTDSIGFLFSVQFPVAPGYRVFLPPGTYDQLQFSVGDSAPSFWLFPPNGGTPVQVSGTNVLGPSNDFIFGNTNSTGVVTYMNIQVYPPAQERDVAPAFWQGLGYGIYLLAFWLIVRVIKSSVTASRVTIR